MNQNLIHGLIGGSGNIGQLMQEFLTQNQSKTISIGRNLPTKKLTNVEYKVADYFNINSLTEALKGCSFAYLLVGLEYKADIWEKDWPRLITSVIEACHNTGAKLVFFDNVYGYGRFDSNIVENLEYNPCSRKGKVRAEVNKVINQKTKEGYIRSVTAKAADFYGPNIATSVVGDRFFEQIITKQTAELVGNKEKIHTFTFVEDIPEALFTLALDDKNNGETFHLPTTDEMLTQAQFAQLACTKAGTDIKKYVEIKGLMLFIFSFFAPILKEFKEMLYQFENDYVFDSTKIYQWYPSLKKATSYSEGLQKTVDYYKSKFQKN
jgi:nucleoside-diphosphate-sugar epimerase